MKAIYHQFEPVDRALDRRGDRARAGAAHRQRRRRLPDVQRRPRPKRSARPVDRGRLLLQHPVHDVDAVHHPRHVRQLWRTFRSAAPQAKHAACAAMPIASEARRSAS